MMMRVSSVGGLFGLWGVLLACSWSSPFIFLQRIADVGSGGFCFGVLVDGTSVSFSGVVLVVVALVYLYSLGYMGEDCMSRKFYFVLSVFVGSMILLIFSGDLVSMFLAWEGLGVSSFLLVVYYNNHPSASSGVITLVSNRVGDMCFLLGLGSMMGWGEFSFLGSDVGGSVLFFFACISKSAQWPLCGWLPAAMAAPTPVSALVHSSTLVTAGAYLLFRFEGVELEVMGWVLVIPLVTMFLASVSALVSYDLKRMVAMSTLSHMGIISWAVLGGYESLAFFHLISHALFKSLLFLCAGVLIQSSGHSQDIRVMGGVLKSSPVFGVGLLFASLNMVGFPLMSGYDSKEMIVGWILSASVQEEELHLMLGVLALVFGGAYAFRFLFLLGGEASSVVVGSGACGVWTGLPVVVLVSLSLMVGKWGHYSSVGLSSTGFISNWGWLSLLFFSGVVGSSSELSVNWYDVGELSSVSSFLSSAIMISSLEMSRQLEMGWLEQVGGEGLYSVSGGIRSLLVGSEWCPHSVKKIVSLSI